MLIISKISWSLLSRREKFQSELEKFTPKEVIKTGHGKILWLRGYKKVKNSLTINLYKQIILNFAIA